MPCGLMYVVGRGRVGEERTAVAPIGTRDIDSDATGEDQVIEAGGDLWPQPGSRPRGPTRRSG